MGAITTAYELDYVALWSGPCPRFLSDVRRTVPMLGDCELLREDLGVRDQPDRLQRIFPVGDGACCSLSCPGRASCPLHPAAQSRRASEDFQLAFQHHLSGHCDEGLVLGRSADWIHFRNWYAMELGQDGWQWTPELTLGWLARDPLLELLLRAAKRGAAMGYAGGGSGEGLLGWLTPTETRHLVETLAPYQLHDHRLVPAGLEEVDLHLVGSVLPEMRDVMRRLETVAARARARDNGIALVRV